MPDKVSVFAPARVKLPVPVIVPEKLLLLLRVSAAEPLRMSLDVAEAPVSDAMLSETLLRLTVPFAMLR